jgi:pilus assembly protein Flp/PilA
VKSAQEGDVNRLIAKFQNDGSGATAIEYALIAAGIAFAILIAVTTVGTNIGATLTNVVSSMP